jgi:methionyl-tRNA synthetase
VDPLDRLAKEAGDLCISRPKSRLAWGIELPFDRDYVTYVWFDALMNYATFAGYRAADGANLPDFQSLWPCDAHVIGKDILVPAHGIYWPVMLKAAGFEVMPKLLVHGWWNLGGAKVSKSAGNVVDPDALADRYGTDALRYYLMRDIATGQDADFNEERLRARYNADLANDLGNLVNRTVSMARRYRGGELSGLASEKSGDVVLAVKGFDKSLACRGFQYEIGKTYLIRTVSMIDTGRVVEVTEQEIVLEDAAWIADTGRYSEATDEAHLKEIEPCAETVFVSLATIIDARIWTTALPRKVK